MNKTITDYPRIFSQLWTQPWDVMPAHHHAISSALLAHLESPQEIKPAENFGVKSSNRDRFLNPVAISTDGRMAVMSISGTLGKKLGWMESACGGTDLAHIDRDIEELKSDSAIETVIFDLDTPGGMARASSDTAERILELSEDKKTIAYTDGTMASAGYKLAAACSKIYSAKSADIGCIGTYIALFDQSEMLEKKGIKLNLFRDGMYKAMGHPGKPMTADETAFLEGEVSGLSAKFKDFVRAHRPDIDPSAMEGQCLSGQAALDAGLIDGFYNSLDELVASEIKLDLTF